jgi:hypothetical protein
MYDTAEIKAFNNVLKRIAPDMRCMFVPSEGIYWVIQVRTSFSGIVLPDNRQAEHFYKLFPIKNIDGTRRNPERRDVEMAIRCVFESQKLQRIGGDKWADEIEAHELGEKMKQQLVRRRLIEDITADTRRIRRGGTITRMGK